MYNLNNAPDYIEFFQDEFLYKVGDLSLYKIAEKGDYELGTVEQLTFMFYDLGYRVFADLLRDEIFLDFPIIGHFVFEDNHYFAISVVGEEVCETTNESFDIYLCIKVGKDVCVLTQYFGCPHTEVSSIYYEKIGDIIPLVEKYTSILELPSIVRNF